MIHVDELAVNNLFIIRELTTTKICDNKWNDPRGVGELLGQGEAVRASGEKPGGNYRFRHKDLRYEKA